MHAPIDEMIRTRVPESLDGLEVKVDGKSLILRSGMLLDVLKVMYGYRRSLRVWQDWISEKLTLLPLSRSKVEPTIYFDKEKQILLAIHVDDFMLLGWKKAVEKIFADLQKEVLIREVGRLKYPDDEVTYLGRTITRTKNGFELRAKDRLIDSYVKVCGVENSKGVETPVVKYTQTQEEQAERLSPNEYTPFRMKLCNLLALSHDRVDVQCAAFSRA